MAEIDKPLPNVDITEKDEAFVEQEVTVPEDTFHTRRSSKCNYG